MCFKKFKRTNRGPEVDVRVRPLFMLTELSNLNFSRGLCPSLSLYHDHEEDFGWTGH